MGSTDISFKDTAIGKIFRILLITSHFSYCKQSEWNLLGLKRRRRRRGGGWGGGGEGGGREGEGGGRKLETESVPFEKKNGSTGLEGWQERVIGVNMSKVHCIYLWKYQTKLFWYAQLIYANKKA